MAKNYGGLRKGMWIDVGGKCAIAYQIVTVEVVKEDGTSERVPHEVEAHFVDDNGDTLVVAMVPFDECKQAGFGMIPEPRRPSKEVCTSFGYK